MEHQYESIHVCWILVSLLYCTLHHYGVPCAVLGQSVLCENSYECYGDSNITGSLIDCYGAYSCGNSGKMEASGSISLTGFHSAFSSSSVTSYSNLDQTECFGASACRNVAILYNYYKGNDCYGSYSCVNVTHTGDNVYGYGYDSSSFATINRSDGILSTIYVAGASSFQYTKINIYGTTWLNTYVDFGMVGAELYCHTGITCSVDCMGYGCANISSMTGGGSYSIDCEYNLGDNIACDAGEFELDLQLGTDIPDILYKRYNQLDDYKSLNPEIGQAMCTSGRNNLIGANCADNKACDYDDILLNNSAVCCTGYYACEYGDIDLTISDDLVVNSSDSIGIMCGGSLSCDETSIIIHNANTYVDSDGNNKTVNVYCDGASACQKATIIRGGYDVFCNSFYACYQVRIYQNENVYSLGYAALVDSEVYDTGKNVYCLAFRSCRDTIIGEIGNVVYGFGYYSLQEANVYNIASNKTISKVYVVGYLTGYQARFQNVESLYAGGHFALQHAKIQGIRELVVSGVDVLFNTTIATGLTNNRMYDESGNMVTMYIKGTNSNSYTVICDTNETCYIYCESSTACTNMILTCNGTCFVVCDEDGNQCPQIVTGNSYLIMAPTSYPTEPSIVPTHSPSVPTYIPSQMPTVVPTEPSIVPTSSPTMPTSDPTDRPTTSPSQVQTNIGETTTNTIANPVTSKASSAGYIVNLLITIVIFQLLSIYY